MRQSRDRSTGWMYTTLTLKVQTAYPLEMPSHSSKFSLEMAEVDFLLSIILRCGSPGILQTTWTGQSQVATCPASLGNVTLETALNAHASSCQEGATHTTRVRPAHRDILRSRDARLRSRWFRCCGTRRSSPAQREEGALPLARPRTEMIFYI